MVESSVTSIILFNVTTTHDLPFQITPLSLPCYTANIHVLLNAALYGDMAEQTAPAGVGSVLDFKNWDLKDLWFRNAGAAANCQIICVATVPTEHVKAVLGL